MIMITEVMTPRELITLLNDPALPGVVDELSARLKKEGQLRRRFYEEITPEMKAEFINGEVIIDLPAKARHTQSRQRIQNLLYNYAQIHNLGLIFGEKNLCTFPRNDYEPDVVFFGRKKAALIHGDTMQFPPPDFACEVLSSSTEQRDRGVKFRDYEAHGVAEYWIVDPKTKTLEQYVIGRGKRYDLRLKSKSGEVISTVVKGFKIPVAAIFDARLAHATLKDLLK
jgi:Uma2 family endonuclease